MPGKRSNPISNGFKTVSYDYTGVFEATESSQNIFEYKVKPQFMYSFHIRTFNLRTIFLYYPKYILRVDKRSLLNVLKFDIRTLSTLSKVPILNSSTLSKVRILNLSTYLE